MAAHFDDEILQLPEKYVTNSCGFALDIGSSVAKLTYRSKQDYNNGKPLRNFGQYEDGQPIGQVHLTMVKREKLDEVIDFIKNYCDITSGEDGVFVNTTGIGGNLFKNRLEKELHIRTSNTFESDCFVKAFCLLRNILPSSSFITPPPEPLKDGGQDGGPQVPTAAIQGWPVFMVMCGSGAGPMPIYADGTHTFVDDTPKAGRFFLGAARCLTGIANFHELIAMAEKGRIHGTGFCSRGGSDLDTVEGGRQGIVEDGIQNLNISEDPITPEDLVRSLLHLVISDFILFLGITSKRMEIYKMCFVGNFVNSTLVQQMMISEIHKYNTRLSAEEEKLEFEFIRNGGHLGSIGAFLLDTIKSSLSEDKPH